MKITLYTITECQFSAQEKEYLKSHNLPFEEKNLETNREFLTEMLTVSNNFAGTPVTKIDKDDGQIVVLKGFTKEEFDKTLGFAAPAGSSSVTPVKEEAPTKAEEKKPEVPAPVATPAPADVTPASQPAVPAAQPAATPAPEVPVVPAQPDPMANILNNLAQQAVTPVAPVQPATPAPAAPQGMPAIPDPQL